jgi:three-Cys-motif partner protein
VASWADDFVYVDGFSGPWLAGDEEYQDTSFGIALTALRKARDEWKRIRNRDVRMRALLVEKSPRAYKRLQQVRELFPDIHIETFNGEFTTLIPDLIRAIPANAFTFVLMDPKGFAIDMRAVQPLIIRPRTEVLFNFMFDFINRFALHNDPNVVAGLEMLMPGTGWRGRLGQVARSTTGDALALARKQVLVDCFSETVATLGGYPHVLETPVFYPLRDRTFYSLIYATRAPAGVEVFRECQVATLKEQDDRRAEAKVADQARRSGQNEFFLDATRMAGRPSDLTLASADAAAREMMAEIVASSPTGMKFDALRLQVMKKQIIKKERVGQLAAEMRKEGLLAFSGWEAKRRVPQDHYVARTGRNSNPDLR